MVHAERGLSKEVVSQKRWSSCGLPKEVVFLWSPKRGGLPQEWSLKRGGLPQEWSPKRGGLPQEWSPKRGTTVSDSCSGGGVQFVLNKLTSSNVFRCIST